MIRFSPKAVTFDCAGTLLRVGWNPATAASVCARTLGLDISNETGADFGAMFYSARGDYEEANLSREPDGLRTFWGDLHAKWLAKHGLGAERAEEFVAVSEGLAYSPAGPWFSPYADVSPCLERLRSAGFRLAVVSNWDTSLGRILDIHGLAESFDVILASLPEGMEKPDPRLFLMATERLGVDPSQTVHVGDDPVDDVEGARLAGLRALWLDRSPALDIGIGTPSKPNPSPPREGSVSLRTGGEGLTDREKVRSNRNPGKITTLDELPEALAWSE